MKTRGFGYLPDLSSIRDLTVDSKEVPSGRLRELDEPSVKKMLRSAGAERALEGVDEVGESSDAPVAPVMSHARSAETPEPRMMVVGAPVKEFIRGGVVTLTVTCA